MKKPVLTDPKGIGGIIAQDGFDYQLWDALIRLPDWLTLPAFEGLILEGLEDYEARFFSPIAPNAYVLDRFQAKSGELTPAEITVVFQSFRLFDAAYPGVARSQTLVTSSLPPTMAWLGRNPERVKKARPFYAPFPDIVDASDAHLREQFEAKFGREEAAYFADYVDVSIRPIQSRSVAEAAFAAALHQSFPHLDLSATKARAVYTALGDFALPRRGEFLSKAELVAIIEGLAGAKLSPVAFPLHIRSDRNSSQPAAFEFDASAFAGGQAGYPAAAIWATDLYEPMNATATWLSAGNHNRVALSGSFRLTTGFAIGSALRSAHGFELEIPTKTGPWNTDDHPGAASTIVLSSTPALATVGDALMLGIGVLRDPTDGIVKTLGMSGSENVLQFGISQAITSAREAQEVVREIKKQVDRAVALLRPASIALYFVGPAVLAVALGHRWNGMPPTQLHEYDSATGTYIPTLLLS